MSLSRLTLLLQHLQWPKLCPHLPSSTAYLPLHWKCSQLEFLSFTFFDCSFSTHNSGQRSLLLLSTNLLRTLLHPSLLCLTSLELPLHWLSFLLISSTPADSFCSSQLHGGCPREGTNLLFHSPLSVINTTRWGGRLRLARLCLKGSVILPSFSLHFSYFWAAPLQGGCSLSCV